MAQRKTTVEVCVQPNAKRDEIVGFRDSILHIRVVAAPRRGQANQALLALRARALVVPKTDLAIVRGHTSRRKSVAVQGLDAEELRLRLAHAVHTDKK